MVYYFSNYKRANCNSPLPVKFIIVPSFRIGNDIIRYILITSLVSYNMLIVISLPDGTGGWGRWGELQFAHTKRITIRRCLYSFYCGYFITSDDSPDRLRRRFKPFIITCLCFILRNLDYRMHMIRHNDKLMQNHIISHICCIQPFIPCNLTYLIQC